MMLSHHTPPATAGGRLSRSGRLVPVACAARGSAVLVLDPAASAPDATEAGLSPQATGGNILISG